MLVSSGTTQEDRQMSKHYGFKWESLEEVTSLRVRRMTRESQQLLRSWSWLGKHNVSFHRKFHRRSKGENKNLFELYQSWTCLLRLWCPRWWEDRGLLGCHRSPRTGIQLSAGRCPPCLKERTARVTCWRVRDLHIDHATDSHLERRDKRTSRTPLWEHAAFWRG